MKIQKLYSWIKLITGLLFLYLFTTWIGPSTRNLLDNEVYDTIESEGIDAGALFYTEEEMAVEAGKKLSIIIKK